MSDDLKKRIEENRRKRRAEAAAHLAELDAEDPLVKLVRRYAHKREEIERIMCCGSSRSIADAKCKPKRREAELTLEIIKDEVAKLRG